MSIRRLSLRDFVIVDALELELGRGYTALTGETGAGKSILIDAIQLLLGQRGDATVVREGRKRCELAAEFDCPNEARDWLSEQGFDAEEDALLLRRQIDEQGRSRAWINGSSATLGQLKSLGETLVDIHGQHAWHSLTRPAAQLSLLDAYAGLETQAIQSAWKQWQQAQHTFEQAQTQQAQWQEQRDRLQWQIAELDKLAPGANEWAELNEAHTRASHAQALIEATQTAHEALSGDGTGAQDALHAAIQALMAQHKWEPRFSPWLDVLQQAQALIEDVAHDVQTYARREDADPHRLQQLNDRLGLWMSLAKRFRCAAPDLADHYASWQEQLRTLDESADLDALQARAAQAQSQWQQEADRLSLARQTAAGRLAESVTAHMQALGMAGGQFSISIARATAGPMGQDDVSFLVAGHAGVSPKPVAKVASGGELSRIALAIAVTTSSLGQVDTLIFDEVDSGIGGQVAHTVGQLMAQLGANRQVMAITHLPQVAATAHQHLKVSKHTSNGETVSQISALNGDQRTEEIARMLGGSHTSVSVLAHAREILGQ